ncbi:MAG: polysaccharide biosynthesis tyrosine autokinase [Gemmatimonadota bacterium]
MIPGPDSERGQLPARPEQRFTYAPGPEPYYGDEVDLRDVWSVIRRRRWVIFGSLAVVLVAVGLYTWLATPVWQASTLIRVDEGDRSNVAVLDVLSSLQRGSELETEMRILRTRPIAEEVVDELDLNLVVSRPADVPRSLVFAELSLDRSTPEIEYALQRLGEGRYRVQSIGEEAGRLNMEAAAGERVEIPGGHVVFADLEALEAGMGRSLPSELRFTTLGFQAAVRELYESLDVARPDREANVMKVAYEGTDRELVRLVPNALAASFIGQRQQVQKMEVRSTVAFLQEQSDLLQAQLEAAEGELQSFREGRQIVALGTEAEAQVERLAELQTERTRLDAERTALANMIRTIDDALGSPDYRRLAAFPTFLNNAAIADILQALTAADRTRTELLLRVTQDHPDLIAVDQRIAELEGQLGSIGRNYLTSLTDQIASLDAVLARFGSELEEIPEKEVQFARLERQTTLLAELYTLLQTRLKEAQVAEAVEDPTVRVVETAILADEPISPRPARNMALAGILGLMLGIGLGFVREYMDTRIHSSDSVEALLGLPTIGRIPALPLGPLFGNGKPQRSAALVTHADSQSVISEAFRNLRTNVRFVRGGEGAAEMVVTSPGPREGKSLTAANLAVVLAQQGIRTLLVDADMRRSVQHEQFGLQSSPGLAELLVGEASLAEAVRPTDVEGLYVMPAGTPPPNPAELLGGDRMDRLLESLREKFSSIVIDSPPMLAVTDAAVLGPKVDGVVLVLRAEQTDRGAASLALSQLHHVGATVLGVVMNDTKTDGAEYYYRSYYGEDGPKPLWRRLLPSRT